MSENKVLLVIVAIFLPPLAVALKDGVGKSLVINIILTLQEAHIAYLQAVYGAMHETYCFIDWELLELQGLPCIEEHKSVVRSLASDLVALSGMPSYGQALENPSVLPTYGVSIGMLFCLTEGTRAARRTAKLAASVLPGLAVSPDTSNGIPAVDFVNLRDNMVRWVNGLQLRQGDEVEASLSAKACVAFVRRHFSEVSQ